MRLFYKVSDKESMKIRKAIFHEVGLPELQKRGFVLSPFQHANHGQWDKYGQSYEYELCRLTHENQLEWLYVSIERKNGHIGMRLKIFELVPAPQSLNDLAGLEGFNFRSEGDSDNLGRRDWGPIRLPFKLPTWLFEPKRKGLLTILEWFYLSLNFVYIILNLPLYFLFTRRRYNIDYTR